MRETIGEQLGVAGKNIKPQHAINPAFYGNALCEVGMDGSETIFFRIMVTYLTSYNIHLVAYINFRRMVNVILMMKFQIYKQ